MSRRGARVALLFLATCNPVLLATLGVGFAMANGCGRTEMDRPAVASSSAGSTTIGGTASSTGGMSSSGGASVGGAGGNGGAAGGGASGVCGEAGCLTSLFQDCVPEGNCFAQGGGGPSARSTDICYSNGVRVFYVGAYNSSGNNVIKTLTVRRNGSLCYEMKTTSGGDVSLVVSDGKGQQVATGTAENDAGPVTMTCNGGRPTTVGKACLPSAGDSQACTLQACP
jgi:hypothetical protein